MSASLIEHFSSLDDPRIERNKRHALMDILVLVVSAVSSDAEGWEGIEEFGCTKLDWLRQYAIPKLLALLELKGCIVTLDAMGCQRAIAEQIKKQEGDYVMGLKGNHSSLHDAVEDYFTTAQKYAFNAVPHTYTEELDKDHGRLEIRRDWITEDLSTLPNMDAWAGLRSIGMVERESTQGGTTTVERRFFIASIQADAKLFAKAVRGHWGIENTLHWRLDVTFSEDASRIRKGNGPAMMTSIRHLCLNLFEREGSKLSLPKKKNKAAWDDAYRAKVLFA